MHSTSAPLNDYFHAHTSCLVHTVSPIHPTSPTFPGHRFLAPHVHDLQTSLYFAQISIIILFTILVILVIITILLNVNILYVVLL